MSRLGKAPISIPNGVEVKVNADRVVVVKGPKGQLELALPKGLTLTMKEGSVVMECDEQKIEKNSFYGLFRSLLKNNIIGVHEGYEVKLALVGVGYRANVQGTKIDLQLGFSHPTGLEIPQGLSVSVDKGTAISVKGIDKRLVGQFAAQIRAVRKPEPYKGKGVRYEGERVRKKEGKAKGKA